MIQHPTPARAASQGHPSEHAPEPGSRPVLKPPPRLVLGCGAGCVLAVLGQIGLVALFGFLIGTAEPPRVALKLGSQPPALRVGAVSGLTLTLTNRDPAPVLLRGLVMAESAERGLGLGDWSPKPTSRRVRAGRVTLNYSGTVRPGQSWGVSFQARPRTAGPVRLEVQALCGLVSVQKEWMLEVRPGKPESARRGRARPGR